jgi:hypothetical protein
MLRWIRGSLENFTAENDFIVTDVEVLTKDLETWRIISKVMI